MTTTAEPPVTAQPSPEPIIVRPFPVHEQTKGSLIGMLLRTTGGQDLVVVQIAGLIARRIVCSVAEGDKAVAGATYGLIRFGSRVDTYVPLGSRIAIEPGQHTIGGETVLAELESAGVHRGH